MTLIDEFTRSPPFGASTNLTIPCRPGAAVWAGHSQFGGGQGGEFGELHCKLGHAVQIGPVPSPAAVSQKREFFKYPPETIGYFAPALPNLEPGDRLPIRKSPPLAGISGVPQDKLFIRRTGWLGREDSNLRMVESKSGRTLNEISVYSEKDAKCSPKCINNLAEDSE